MAVLNKDLRPVHVDGCIFRWRVRSRPTYAPMVCESPIVVAVVPESPTGSTLLINLPQSHPGNILGETAAPVLPSKVANYIRLAIESGWKPKKNGKPFILKLS